MVKVLISKMMGQKLSLNDKGKVCLVDNNLDVGIEILTINEAAKFLNMKVSNLRSAVFKRKIPYLKLGALIRFKKSDLVEWLEKSLVYPINPNN